MQTTKKKPSLILTVIGAVFAAYFGYLAGGAWETGMDIMTFYHAFCKVCARPFANYWCSSSPKAVATALIVYALLLIMYYTSQRKYMPGKEFGTAQFVSPKMVSRSLSGRDKNYQRILSQNVRMSLNTRVTGLNDNVLVIGGSGAGKTFYEVKPNLMEMPRNCSFICTDPKGELLRSTGTMLEKNGYEVKVLNLLEMEKSSHYNPFAYIRKEQDIISLITNIISNTTPKDSHGGDPFWEHAEGMFLQSIFFYVWMELPRAKQNFRTVMDMIAMAELKPPVNGKKVPSDLDRLMEELEQRCKKENRVHPAVRQYKKSMGGAADTVRSILISVNSRLAKLENDAVLNLLAEDEMNLAEVGIGKNGDKKTRTALYCVIPDSDKSYNFIVGMLYTQVFQELYYQADFNFGGRLPIHVTFMLDEFANVALPDDYCSLLSTMRSREISSVIIIQNLAQIKALFKDTWETIPGNCDTLIYLGGNEQSTHKYISELLGKSTIDKKSSGETKGRQGSSSRNYDVLGRELYTPDEVRKLDNRQCFIFIRGFDPVIDSKFYTPKHPNFYQTADGSGEPYVKSDGKKERAGVEFLDEDSMRYYEERQHKGDRVWMDTLTMEQFRKVCALMEYEENLEIRQKETTQEEKKKQEESGGMIRDEAVEYSMNEHNSYNLTDIDSEEERMHKAGEKLRKLEEYQEKSPEDCRKELKDRMCSPGFTNEQRTELNRALKDGVPVEYILTYAKSETGVPTMMAKRMEYLNSKK
jgi:type IV secretion system protein VirD4